MKKFCMAFALLTLPPADALARPTDKTTARAESSCERDYRIGFPIAKKVFSRSGNLRAWLQSKGHNADDAYRFSANARLLVIGFQTNDRADILNEKLIASAMDFEIVRKQVLAADMGGQTFHIVRTVSEIEQSMEELAFIISCADREPLHF